jgi:hypothetical protein
MDMENCFLGRQPILDRKEQICAYELLFRSSHSPHANISNHSVASAKVILNVLSGFGVQEIPGGCPRIEEPAAKPSDRSIFPDVFDK